MTDVSDIALEAVYKALARRCHPDLAQSPEERAWRHQLMQQVNAAYQARDFGRLDKIGRELEGRPTYTQATTQPPRRTAPPTPPPPAQPFTATRKPPQPPNEPARPVHYEQPWSGNVRPRSLSADRAWTQFVIVLTAPNKLPRNWDDCFAHCLRIVASNLGEPGSDQGGYLLSLRDNITRHLERLQLWNDEEPITNSFGHRVTVGRVRRALDHHGYPGREQSTPDKRSQGIFRRRTN